MDYHLWGFRPLPYHVENLLLHVLAALLFWGLLRRLQVPGAWLAGAIFALHPVMVESVAWITERKNVLSLALYLGALLAYLRYAQGMAGGEWQVASGTPSSGPGAAGRGYPTPDTRHPSLFYGLAFFLFLAALLAKATAFSLPAVILLICWWKRGRIRWRTDILPTLPFFAMAIGLCLGTAWLEKNHVGAKGPEWVISFPERCLIAGRALWFYTGKLFWPANLCFIYPRWQLDASSSWQWLYPITAVGTLFTLWQTRARIGRGPLAAALFFVGTLFPVLGFMNAYFMRYSFVCDHWVYLSSLGLIALAAGLVVRAAEHLRIRPVLYGLAAVVLPVLAILTWRQCGIYADMETLWRDTLAKNPGAWLAQNNLGVVLWNQGKIQEAIGHFNEAVRIQPYSEETHHNLGLALVQQGKLEEAITHWKRALQIKPDYPEAHYNWGLALEQMGRNNDAIGQYEQALRLKPDLLAAHCNLGGVLMRQGRIQEAVEHYNEAVRILPNSAEAQNSLAMALWQAGQVKEAIAHWELALHIQPDYPEAQNSLAWLLATLGPAEGGDPVRAVALAERACSLTGYQVPGDIDTLATAYAAAGRFNDAIATAQKAIELARSAGQSQLVGEIQARLQLYRSGRAYSRSPDTTSPRNP
jgi:tetratricopeptide (TPR) repeat protein